MTVTKAPQGHDLVLAASLATQSDHPLSNAVAKLGQNLDLQDVQDVQEYGGQGMQALVGGIKVKLGRAEWVGCKSIEGYVQTWLKVANNPPVAFLFEETVKPSSQDAVTDLQKLGLKIVLLSGDTQSSAIRLAEKLGIPNAVGDVFPDEKLALVQSYGDHVLMIGDGLNDTAALAAAHVSMSPASAIDAARAASDFVLIKDDLTLIGSCIALSKSSKRRMLENFGIAAGYNAIAIPIALIGLATPLLAALAMSASSICVSLNALRLPKVR
jgi:Cu2+-exporting ATPase